MRTASIGGSGLPGLRFDFPSILIAEYCAATVGDDAGDGRARPLISFDRTLGVTALA